ncbi:hypothetical protein [Streptomyces sp. NPDC085596]|uniref:hypothetical protein n=1 Tax=Streptomyces sp. NPDC085596 TaxID=3365731 RepID=UPI0037CD8BF0
MRDDDLMPEAIIGLLRSTWDELLEEVYAAVTGGWLAKHLEETGDPGDAEVFMNEKSLDEAVFALAQAVENTSGFRLPGDSDAWHRSRVHAALETASDLICQSQVTAAANGLDPVPRSTAAHALLAGAVYQLRQARAARQFWKYEKSH